MVLYSLTRLGFTDIPAGDWSGAISRQNEALGLAQGTEQQVLFAGPLAWLLLIAALRGEASTTPSENGSTRCWRPRLSALSTC
jgi:hypothetical protein